MKERQYPNVQLDVVRVKVLLRALQAASAEGHKPLPQNVEVVRVSGARDEIPA